MLRETLSFSLPLLLLLFLSFESSQFYWCGHRCEARRLLLGKNDNVNRESSATTITTAAAATTTTTATNNNEFFFLPLDQSQHGAGGNCPKFLPDYMESLNQLFNTITESCCPEESRGFQQTGRTSDGTGQVWWDDTFQKTAYFQSDFINLHLDQVNYIKSIFEDALFSKELAPSTHREGSRKVYRNTTMELGETSQLARYTIGVIPNFPPSPVLFDQETVFIEAKKEVLKNNNDTICTIYANPSVSNDWIETTLDDPLLSRTIQRHCPFLERLLNQYPTGDRVCITPSQSSTTTNDNNDLFFDVQVIHMSTTSVGGILFGGFTSLLPSCLATTTQDFYLSEAQLLEDKIKAMMGA